MKQKFAYLQEVQRERERERESESKKVKVKFYTLTGDKIMRIN